MWESCDMYPYSQLYISPHVKTIINSLVYISWFGDGLEEGSLFYLYGLVIFLFSQKSHVCCKRCMIFLQLDFMSYLIYIIYFKIICLYNFNVLWINAYFLYILNSIEAYKNLCSSTPALSLTRSDHILFLIHMPLPWNLPLT